jgi:hypothetical protein
MAQKLFANNCLIAYLFWELTGYSRGKDIYNSYCSMGKRNKKRKIPL